MLAAALAALATGACSSPALRALPAFPGAEGFGSTTPGGRGGRVIAVTNLRDSGPGSLRAALSAEGPRIVVFRTGGTIVLQKPLVIANPYLTVAGQTAPGGGLQLRHDREGSATFDSFPTLHITTHDVVIRYLRLRPGTLRFDASCDAHPRRGKEQRCAPPGDIVAILFDDDAKRVVIDHVSAGWSTDEIVGLTWAHDVTIQWSLLAEALSYVFYDPKDPRKGKGMSFGNKHSARRGRFVRRISIHHNLFASNATRNPAAASACGLPDDPAQCLTDVRNNVIHNWGEMGTITVNVGGHNFVNVVGNVYKAGPDTLRQASALWIVDWTKTSHVPGAGSHIRPHFDQNLMLGRDGRAAPIRTLCTRMGRRPDGEVRVVGHCVFDEVAVANAYEAPAIESAATTEVYEAVLASVGANLLRREDGEPLPARDATDRRIVREVREGGGRIIRRPEDFPGWPTLEPGKAPSDRDADGMPDAWEERHGFDANAAASRGADADGDGYTDVEEFLNGTDPRAGD